MGADENDITYSLELLREQDVATLLIKKEKPKKLNIGWDKELMKVQKNLMEFKDPTAIDWMVTYLTLQSLM